MVRRIGLGERGVVTTAARYGAVITETRNQEPSAGRRLGHKGRGRDLCVVALAALSMIVLLALYFGWPMVGGDLPYDRTILIAAPTFLVLGGAGFLWVYLYVFPLARGAGRRSWWALAAPVVVVAALVDYETPSVERE